MYILYIQYQLLYDMLCHMDEYKVLTYFQVKEFLKKEKLKRRCNHCWLLDMIREYYERCNGVSRLQSKQIVFSVWHYKTAVPISRMSIDGIDYYLVYLKYTRFMNELITFKLDDDEKKYSTPSNKVLCGLFR